LDKVLFADMLILKLVAQALEGWQSKAEERSNGTEMNEKPHSA
jgi:hypothetical protein